MSPIIRNNASAIGAPPNTRTRDERPVRAENRKLAQPNRKPTNAARRGDTLRHARNGTAYDSGASQNWWYGAKRERQRGACRNH